MAEPWEQLPAETGAAYNAFRAFLALGPTRSVDGAYKAHKGIAVGPDTRHVRAAGGWKRWYRDNRWVERATAWDHRNQQVQQKAHEQVIAANAAAQTREQLRAGRRILQEEQEWELRGMLIEKAKEMLASKLFVQKASLDGRTVEIKPAKWSFQSMAKILELATRLGRTSARMPLAIEEEPDSDADDKFFETSGQLAEALPPGAVPEMPADTYVKPQIHVGKAEAGKDGNPIQPPKVRPG